MGCYGKSRAGGCLNLYMLKVSKTSSNGNSHGQQAIWRRTNGRVSSYLGWQILGAIKGDRLFVRNVAGIGGLHRARNKRHILGRMGIDIWAALEVVGTG
jgi:hypothetical protein